jgi:hypothetical protein
MVRFGVVACRSHIAASTVPKKKGTETQKATVAVAVAGVTTHLERNKEELDS